MIEKFIKKINMTDCITGIKYTGDNYDEIVDFIRAHTLKRVM